MSERGVVVIGAGHAGTETAAALRSQGFTEGITLVGDESTPPYERPPLSKAYLAGTVQAEDLRLRSPSFFSTRDIELVTDDRAVRIDREAQTVVLRSGRSLRYGSLVLATGARPRSLPVPGVALNGVLTLRGLDDARTIRKRLTPDRPRRLVVVGAGFIGLELAATARTLGHRVTVVEALPAVLSRAVTPVTATRLAQEHRRQGVRLLLRREVTGLVGDAAGRVCAVDLNNGERLPADLVVLGIGVLPNTALADDAELLAGDGVIVDEYLRTSDPAIRVIGDCARFPDPRAGRLVRLESVQNATDQARCVAMAICGKEVPYSALPWFWSEQYGLRLQIAGLAHGHDRTAVSGDRTGGRFSVFCFREGRLIGVESVNRPADHGIARRLLSAGEVDITPAEVAEPGFDLKDRVRRRQPA